MQNDLISRSALIEEIKAEIENFGKEKQDYAERGIYHNMHMMGERIKGARSILKIIENQPAVYDIEELLDKNITEYEIKFLGKIFVKLELSGKLKEEQFSELLHEIIRLAIVADEHII